MYGIFTHIWLICMVNVGKCTIHGSYGHQQLQGRRNSTLLRLDSKIPAVWKWVMKYYQPKLHALLMGNPPQIYHTFAACLIRPKKKLIVAQPSSCCSFARHLIGKMVIHCSFAHHDSHSPESNLTLRIQICPKNPGFPRSNPMTWGLGMFRPSILLDRNRFGFLGIWFYMFQGTHHFWGIHPFVSSSGRVFDPPQNGSHSKSPLVFWGKFPGWEIPKTPKFLSSVEQSWESKVPPPKLPPPRNKTLIRPY